GRAATLNGRRDLLRCDLQAHAVEIAMIEFARVLFDGGVAARRDIADDGTHRRLDISRSFALGFQERAKSYCKVGGCYFEADGHRIGISGLGGAMLSATQVKAAPG